jgi:flagellar biosynthesis/type III secretory pathway protein FliH
MGRLIEEQAVIDCLTNTAKYYEREDADKWTKGIHYGLLHGVDNILDNVPTVEAIPKDQYEARLKADMVAMLTEIQLEIEEMDSNHTMPDVWSNQASKEIWNTALKLIEEIIEVRINNLKGMTRDDQG